jgi:hypothetical protein
MQWVWCPITSKKDVKSELSPKKAALSSFSDTGITFVQDWQEELL